jgi:RimJ/RimL family protein N-acetyltransferase
MKIDFRKIEISDVEFVNKVRNNYAFEFLHDSRKFTVEETKEWFIKTNPDFWMIIFENQTVGYFRLSNWSKENKNIYIGADISEEFTGKGIVQEAYKMFIPFLFKEYDLNKISLEVLSTNKRAIYLYKKIGFNFEGVKREEVLKGEEFINSEIYSILKKEL